MCKQKRFNTDATALKIAAALLKDLDMDNRFVGDPRLWKLDFTPLDSYEFKKYHQVTNLFAKYIFTHEDSALYDGTAIACFIETQQRLKSHSYSWDDPEISEVISYARGTLSDTLKEYDLDEHLEACYFPKKASVGNGLARSTLSAKWLTGLTGSVEQCEWFTRIYKPWHSHCVARKSCGTTRIVDELQASLIAKRWNKRRMICPNTGIGGLYSNGLGRVLENRLMFLGHSFAILPETHRKLARAASISNTSATIDQTTASDNITVQLLRLLFPRRWCAAIEKGRISTIRFDEDTAVHCETLSTMGIGFTFPLQTLIFLSLALACRSVYERRGRRCVDRTVSCFGDDLVVPSELRALITKVFDALGLIISEPKSFWTGPFRESCGGDYHRGCDVRPTFLPTGGDLTKHEFLSFLYKTFNLFRDRWTKYEIPTVLRTILTEIRMVGPKRIHTVPFYFGHDAGLKLDLTEFCEFGLELPKRNKHGSFNFWRLVKTTNRMKVDDHDCYYWYSLQFSRGFLRAHYDARGEPDSLPDFGRSVYGLYTPRLELERTEKQPKNYRSKITGKKLVKMDSAVALAGDSGFYKQEQASACTWE